MLRQRVITAAVLLVVLALALVTPAWWPFALLMLLAVSTAGWEWGRLNGASGAGAVIAGVLVGLACVATLFAPELPNGLWWAVSVAWIVLGALALRVGVAGWGKVPSVLRLVVGLVLLWATWLAITSARVIGINYLLSVLSLVWAADISAYFGGRAFGRRKLAPTISPGKSWAGVYSGVIGVLVVAFVWVQVERRFDLDSASFYSDFLERFGAVALFAALVVMTALSVVGDLVESLAKRSVGAKDSSQVLPGHGGVLDRIDALLPVLPLSLALIHLPNLR